MPARIDPWAYQLALGVAAPRGWRASEVYAVVMKMLNHGIAQDTVAKVLHVINENAQPGESFAEVHQRIANIAAEMA